MTPRAPGGGAAPGGAGVVEALPRRAGEALEELRATLDRAAALANEVSLSRPAATGAIDKHQVELRIGELENRLVDVQSDRDELSSRLGDYEQQVGRLMNLYVATYQLHATLDPAEVQATIAEIAINLLGAERFVLLFKSDAASPAAAAQSSGCEIALQQGLEGEASGLYQSGQYTGGDPQVDATLLDGVLRIGPFEDSQALAIVPLTVQGATVGALVILKLLGHKAALRSDDRDLLDLLAAHAASALFAARVYSNTDRKLKTLESLVKLVRRQ